VLPGGVVRTAIEGDLVALVAPFSGLSPAANRGGAPELSYCPIGSDSKFSRNGRAVAGVQSSLFGRVRLTPCRFRLTGRGGSIMSAMSATVADNDQEKRHMTDTATEARVLVLAARCSLLAAQIHRLATSADLDHRPHESSVRATLADVATHLRRADLTLRATARMA
jgi:hypothetical protein